MFIAASSLSEALGRDAEKRPLTIGSTNPQRRFANPCRFCSRERSKGIQNLEIINPLGTPKFRRPNSRSERVPEPEAQRNLYKYISIIEGEPLRFSCQRNPRWTKDILSNGPTSCPFLSSTCGIYSRYDIKNMDTSNGTVS
ncbi:hypothetical protein I7I51_02440 [Histoplasma capsulatum]|uniref:Uncharacterized protein n=1 Tax=Ajellomyces capsulatus TaxID=5037 RepID=A0A8A1M9R0_AJECA|nr:hypothetical protein I7I51_02440 [Histoplasma capsulatum]